MENAAPPKRPPLSRRGKSRGSGDRQLHQRVRTAKGRKPSSTRWLERQLNDPFVAAAKSEGYRSRAAFKLIEIDDKFGFLGPGKRVLELGAAPGAWTQVNVTRCRGGRVVAVDIEPMEALPGATVLQLDALSEGAADRLREAVGEEVDVVQSDMAAPSTGHAQTDHLRIMALCEAALDVAEYMLAPDGAFIAKVLQGGTERTLLTRMKHAFREVKHVKPKASRSDSAEVYVVAIGFRGKPEND